MNIGMILYNGKQQWQCNICEKIHEGFEQASDCCCQLSIESLSREANGWMQDLYGNVESVEAPPSH